MRYGRMALCIAFTLCITVAAPESLSQAQIQQPPKPNLAPKLPANPLQTPLDVRFGQIACGCDFGNLDATNFTTVEVCVFGPVGSEYTVNLEYFDLIKGQAAVKRQTGKIQPPPGMVWETPTGEVCNTFREPLLIKKSAGISASVGTKRARRNPAQCVILN